MRRNEMILERHVITSCATQGNDIPAIEDRQRLLRHDREQATRLFFPRHCREPHPLRLMDAATQSPPPGKPEAALNDDCLPSRRNSAGAIWHALSEDIAETGVGQER